MWLSTYDTGLRHAYQVKFLSRRLSRCAHELLLQVWRIRWNAGKPAACSTKCRVRRKISVPSLGHAHAKHCTRPPKRPKVAVVKWVLPRKTIKCLAQSSHVLHADETFMESSARSPRPHSARSVGSLVWHSCPDSLESCCRASGQFKLAQHSFHQQLSMFDLVLSSKLCSA